MEYIFDMQKPRKQKIERLSDKFFGKDARGREIGFNNYYMLLDDKPFFGISGECHYSRVTENQWEDTILKMKMGGVNVVATYLFWIHHEEEEGVFCFDGNRNVRKFIELCKQHGLFVIVRIGPFDHGEVRNGGLPDWLYGKPFEVRSANEGFLSCTRRWYHAVAEQLKGLYFQDGGPIIGAQIDNEYMHSAAPWEMTAGSSNEWITSGDEGNVYMLALKKIAQEEGIVTPFYTCTGWGGAAAPTEEMLPLWGGYAFWPWIFYNRKGEHPVTPEYIYRDNHNNEVKSTYNFDPSYEPESRPYACCEMGGGMTCCYQYRFQLPYESVDAMANIKLASGCNFLGYYMYRGGSNPKGKRTPYLNEGQCPKISYDYQAPIGEFGQVRPSFHRLRALHQFLKTYQEQFCELVTVLPEGSQEIVPEDVKTLRFAARTDGKRGFLFLNNYQDHMECESKIGEAIRMRLDKEEFTISGISLAGGEEAVLPFNLNMEGYLLKYAKAQPLAIMKEEKRTLYVFFTPAGMEPEYCFDTKGMERLDGKRVVGEQVSVRPFEERKPSFIIEGQRGTVEVLTLTREESLQFYEISLNGKQTFLLADTPVTFNGTTLRVESPEAGSTSMLKMYPAMELAREDGKALPGTAEDFWTKVEIPWEGTEERPLKPVSRGAYRYIVKLPKEEESCKDMLLRINYRGDIGSAFLNGEMVSDNFSNGAVWEIGLKELPVEKQGRELTILITPKKLEAKVDVSSTMAGRSEVLKETLGELRGVTVRKIKEQRFHCGFNK